MQTSRGLFRLPNHNNLPIMRCQSWGLIVVDSNNSFARAVTLSSLSVDGVMIPVLKFQIQPIKLRQSSKTAAGLLDLASASGRRFMYSILRVSRRHVLMKSEGQSNVKVTEQRSPAVTASSMIWRKRGERCSGV